MDQAATLNAAGNEPFRAGHYPKAADLYEKEVAADGKGAKYRTNLAKALIKSGRYVRQL